MGSEVSRSGDGSTFSSRGSFCALYVRRIRTSARNFGGRLACLRHASAANHLILHHVDDGKAVSVW